MFAYPRIAERLFGRAHTIEPVALHGIMQGRAVRRILSGDAKHDETVTAQAVATRRARLAAYVQGETVIVDEGCEYALTRDGVAVVPVFGVLAQRFDWLAALCGWATYEGIIKVCHAMANDYRVHGVMFNIESPGGEVSGMLDASDAIIELGQLKPVWSIANAYAYSAAYALAGSAEIVCIPRMADVGSIGAVAVHVDESASDAELGLKFTAVYSGARKIDCWEHAPLEDAARSVLQDRVDYARKEFANQVGRQGRISAAAAMATEAALYTDQAAVDVGLADKVMNFDQAMEYLTELAADAPRNVTLAAKSTLITTERNNTMAIGKTAAQIAAEEAEAKIKLEAETKAKADADEKTHIEAEAKSKAEAEAKLKADIEAKAKADAEAKALPTYGMAEIDETLELCQIAKAPLALSRELIKAKTPIAEVRKKLSALSAEQDSETELNATPPYVAAGGGSSWNKIIEKRFGTGAK